MKKNILNFLFFAFTVFTSIADASPLINSHLRTWNSAIVENHYQLGADIIEIDISNIDDLELQNSFDVLSKFPGKIMALHLKGFSENELPQIEKMLENNKTLWPQFWFFSGDSKLDEKIRLKFNLAFITRSTKQNVMACLSGGLTDEKIFLENCIEKELWIRPSMMSDYNSKIKMKHLVQKIRNFENAHSVSSSLIALDQIDSKELYCNFVPMFLQYIDGIVTENFAAMQPLLFRKQQCP